jgi:nicotinate-nucleotide adenylyltransferase
MGKLFFGGSFNPIHVGHLVCARSVAEQTGADATVLVPSAAPPHKSSAANLAPAQHRLKMCQFAAAGCENFDVDDLETRRIGPSYTIDTARELAARGEGRVRWLIGGDMLRNLPHWHEPMALLDEVDFVVMARPAWSFDWDTMPAPFRKLRGSVVSAPLIEISATEIRNRVRAGMSIDFMTPEPVVRYIHQAGLYRA